MRPRSPGEPWEPVLAPLRDDLDTIDWRRVADRVHGALRASSDAIGGLKAYLRALVRDGSEELDPWRVELLVARELPELRELRGRFWTSRAPRHGSLEPDTHLRSWAIVRALVHALSGRASLHPFPGAEVTDTIEGPGARPDPATAVCWWWLTGRDPPTERTAQREVGGRVHRALAPLGILSARALVEREAALRAWDKRGTPERRTLAAELDELDGCVKAALAAAVAGISRQKEHASLVIRALEIGSSRRDGREGGAGPLASWCARATVIGIAAAIPTGHAKCERALTAAARALASELSHVVARSASLHEHGVAFPFWRAWAVLVRERHDAHDTAVVEGLLRDAAESGAWTGAINRDLHRVAAILGNPARLEPFFHRLAWTTARARGRTPEHLWKDAISPLIARRASASSTPALHAAALERWWTPVRDLGDRTFTLQDAVATTRALAGPELDVPAGDGSAWHPSYARWWNAPSQRSVLDDARDPSCPLRHLARTLARREDVPAPATPARPIVLLALRRAAGQHGETYVAPMVIAGRGGTLETVDLETTYPALVSRTSPLARISTERGAVERAAAAGRRPDLRALLDATVDLFDTHFLQGLWRVVDGARFVVDAFEPSIAWEAIAPPGGEPPRPLGIVAAVQRPRHRRSDDLAPPRPLRSLLFVHPPHDRGGDVHNVSIELAAVREAWNGELAVATDAASAAARLAEGAVDVLHYAGHLGRDASGVPALPLGGAQVPLGELARMLDVHPPQLVFLHACRSALPSRAAAGNAVTFGSLEPLQATAVRALIGTLWDVAPPSTALVSAFYRSIASGHDPADALHHARLAVHADPAWDGWWQAYVLYAP